MEDHAIFICHDCKVSTKAPALEYKNVNIRSLKLTHALNKFRAQHKDHDTCFYPDCNGQYRSGDYDFNTRTFRHRNWW